MTAIYFPEAVKVQGTTKITIGAACALPAAPDLSSEINAAGSVEATDVIRAWNPVTNVNTGNSPARLGTTVQLPQEGNAQLQPIPLAFPFDPSVDDADANNKLKALLTEGDEVFVWVRKGVDINTDWAVADRVETWHCRVGHVDDDARSGDDEFAEYEVHVNLIPLGPKVIGAVAA